MEDSVEDIGPTPTLPPNTIVSYLAEGAANIVYRISVSRDPTPEPSLLDEYGDGTPPPTEIELIDRWPGREDGQDLSIFDDKLLRLRKDLPTTLPCAVSQAGFHNQFRPMFDENQLVQQSLVRLGPSRIISRLNAELLRSIPPRPISRLGVFLAEDDYGLLITDMTAHSNRDIIEFKPKWLLQSPSAPKRSLRCRQCAQIARKNAERTLRGQSLLKTYCPLDLISSDKRDILRVAEILLHPESSKPNIHRFARWIQSTNLLRRLSTNQHAMDEIGPLTANPDDEKFRISMTLRDVTVYVRFLKYPQDGYDEVEARIGDLDMKSPQKGLYWRNTEHTLIEEGWYLGEEKFQQPLTCHLSPKRWQLGD